MFELFYLLDETDAWLVAYSVLLVGICIIIYILYTSAWDDDDES